MDPGLLEDWLALFHLPGMSSRLFHTLVEVFASPAAVLRAEPAGLASAGLEDALVGELRGYQEKGRASPLGQQVARALAWREAPEQHLLVLSDDRYPPLLKAIPDPPPLLFVRGNAALLHAPQLAMVGSRTPTAGGCRLARRFAAAMGAAGYAITSGLALGIDRESHLGAVESGTPTLAVLGSGIDQVYPWRNRSLAERILAQGGALVSEFPLGTKPIAWHFPRRNRIISGLSRGVLVVEAAFPSGSLITARFALEQGREVFAVPGSIDNPRTRGCHRLIREGAVLVESAADILEEIGDLRPDVAAPEREAGRAAEPGGASEAKVLAGIGHDRVSLDQLLAATGLPVGELSAALVQLEILGRIESVNGGYTLRGLP